MGKTVTTDESQPKTSSERGRAFRNRERQRLLTLEKAVDELRHEIQEKRFLKGVWEAKYFRSRHSQYGSLTRLLEEYYTILRHGVHASTGRGGRGSPSGVDPVEFLSRVTHPEATLGDVVGQQAMVDQWQIYTTAHTRFKACIHGIEVYGPEDDPVVFARLQLSGQMTRETFLAFFPRAIHSETLIQTLIGRQVTYPGTTLLRFSPDQRIAAQVVHLDFVEALCTAGATLEEVNQLMQGAALTPMCTVLDSPNHERDEATEWSL